MKASKVVTSAGKAAASAGPDSTIVTSLIATGIIVTLGQWVKKEKVSMKTFLGMGALVVFLAVLQDINSKLATQFAMLILITAVLIYGVPVGQKIAGLAK